MVVEEDVAPDNNSPFVGGPPQVVAVEGAEKSRFPRGAVVPQEEGVSTSLKSALIKSQINIVKTNVRLNVNKLTKKQKDRHVPKNMCINTDIESLTNDQVVSNLPVHSPVQLQTLETPTDLKPRGEGALLGIPHVVETEDRVDLTYILTTKDIHPALSDLSLQSIDLTHKIGGRLQLGLPNWQKLTQDPLILQTVVGLKIPFVEVPCQMREPKQYPLSAQDSLLIESEITSMMDKGAISEVHRTQTQFVSPLFLVPKKDGTQRPVINLKGLNAMVQYQHFKMEGLHLLKDLIQPNDFMIKIDLKDAYFSVPVHPPHRPYLKFRWGSKLYQFNCMPFGLGPAPRMFTKLLKPVVAFLRRMGIRIIVYLDDMIILNQNASSLRTDRNSLLLLLTQLGFAINWKKSSLIPTQNMEFLGFTIQSVQMLISLPQDKVERIIAKCQKLISDRVVKVRNLAEIVGLLTSSMRAILPAPLHYRRLQMAQAKGLVHGQSYETKLTLPPETISELRWWIENIRDWNGRAIITPSPDLTIETDASSTIGWGAVWKDQRIGGAWSPEEKLAHINVLELKGALFAVRSFAADKRNVHVHLKMDNTSAVAYVQKMGGGHVPPHCWK